MKRVSTSFKVGDSVVYPGYGVGKISSIEFKEIKGKRERFIILEFNETGNVSTVMIPDSSVERVGIRYISSKIEVEKAFNVLKSPVEENYSSWKERFTAHSEMVQKGDLISIAKVLKSLYTHNQKKPLSFREKKLYQKCYNLLLSESSLAINKSKEEIEKLIICALEGNP